MAMSDPYIARRSGTQVDLNGANGLVSRVGEPWGGGSTKIDILSPAMGFPMHNLGMWATLPTLESTAYSDSSSAPTPTTILTRSDSAWCGISATTSIAALTQRSPTATASTPATRCGYRVPLKIRGWHLCPIDSCLGPVRTGDETQSPSYDSTILIYLLSKAIRW